MSNDVSAVIDSKLILELRTIMWIAAISGHAIELMLYKNLWMEFFVADKKFGDAKWCCIIFTVEYRYGKVINVQIYRSYITEL